MMTLAFGDMTVIGELPMKLLKACAVVADTLHQEFARDPDMEHPDKSKESCVLCSLAVRDFLRSIGFVNARVRPVVAILAAWEGETILHSVGIGVPDTPRVERRWCGHMVVWVPGSRTLIDTTLYPAVRPQWKDLPPMLAITCNRKDVGGKRVGGPCDGMPPIAALSLTDSDRPTYEFGITYLDNPGNVTWHGGPDARDTARRRIVVEAMREKFGRWRG
jgi:hypothetical protein